MSIYTITPDFLKNIENIYFTDVLFLFTLRTHPCKVAIDKKSHIINIYSSISNNRDIIKMWLDLMSFTPSPFEVINVDIESIECEETAFVKVCKETKGSNKIIYYSKQNISKFECNNNCIAFEGKTIKVLDREDAKNELNVSVVMENHNSIVALQNSSITDSSIEK